MDSNDTENVYLTKYYTATYVSNPMKTQEGYFLHIYIKNLLRKGASDYVAIKFRKQKNNALRKTFLFKDPTASI